MIHGGVNPLNPATSLHHKPLHQLRSIQKYFKAQEEEGGMWLI